MDKELLLKDLCARLPYGVKVRNIRNNFDISYFDNNVKEIKTLIEEYGIKPYLRPMSSMTEEESKEYAYLCDNPKIGDFERLHLNVLDWFLENHFDFRGLIEKGLALEATKDMYES